MVDDIYIPWGKPIDEYVCEAVDELVAVVSARNDRIQCEREYLSNSRFAFLSSPYQNEYKYYLWRVTCRRYSLSDNLETSIKTQYIESLLKAPPGSVDLIEDDKTHLYHLIQNNSGTKDSIKGIRKWILERSHSLISCGLILHQFVVSIKRANLNDVFQTILCVIYIINDLLFNGNSLTSEGVYFQGLTHQSFSHTSINVLQCLKYPLGSILHDAYSVAPNDIDREKVRKILELWEIKGFIDDSQKRMLGNQMLSANSIPPPPPPPLISPESIIRFVFDQTLRFASQNSADSRVLPVIANTRIPPPPPISAPGYSLPQPHDVITNISYNRPQVSSYPTISQTNSTDTPISVRQFNLTSLTVGNFANLTKLFLEKGNPKYSPMDPNFLLLPISKPVEPGRLQANIDEFYRKLNE